MELTFTTLADALALPPPGVNRDSHDIKHSTQAGFYVRVMKPDRQGRIRRKWVCRYDVYTPDGSGGLTKTNKKEAFANVAALDDDEIATPLEDALAYVLQKRKSLRNERTDGSKSSRLTVGKAMEAYPIEKAANRSRTLAKDMATMERYFSHLKDRFLDELDYQFWARFVAELRAGKLQVGWRQEGGKRTPIVYGPLKNATLIGVLNAASSLYDIGHRYKGLQGMDRDENPAKLAKALVGRARKKKHLVQLEDLGKAWLAADVLVSPHWRALFKVCVLTGLRRSLVWSMRFDEIDFKEGLYRINPLKEGTKQRGHDFGEESEPLVLPLSKAVLSILRERRLFAPDKDGPIWYAPGKNAGRRRMNAVLGDQRSAWSIISEHSTGYSFGPQDLRRTFATLGSVAVKGDLFAVALLMMHSSTTLARTVGLPEITVRYINTPSARAQMREAAEKISSFVDDLVAKAVAGVKVEYDVGELPIELEAAIGPD